MSEMSKSQLKRRIMELSFAKLECQLFLDTHPECRNALDHFYRYSDELDELTEMYDAEHGPLTPSGIHGDRWSWVDTPWPWQNEKGE